jgi:hypothetical protein
MRAVGQLGQVGFVWMILDDYTTVARQNLLQWQDKYLKNSVFKLDK